MGERSSWPLVIFPASLGGGRNLPPPTPLPQFPPPLFFSTLFHLFEGNKPFSGCHVLLFGGFFPLRRFCCNIAGLSSPSLLLYSRFSPPSIAHNPIYVFGVWFLKLDLELHHFTRSSTVILGSSASLCHQLRRRPFSTRLRVNLTRRYVSPTRSHVACISSRVILSSASCRFHQSFVVVSHSFDTYYWRMSFTRQSMGSLTG